jgi:hypothetical protein
LADGVIHQSVVNQVKENSYRVGQNEYRHHLLAYYIHDFHLCAGRQPPDIEGVHFEHSQEFGGHDDLSKAHKQVRSDYGGDHQQNK